MPVFRTEKVADYAVIAKHHLKNRALSYKAKGLLTFMLSVPPEWDWSMAGLSTLASDGVDGVRSGIRELEKHGYLTRRRIRDAGGKLGDVEYTIHEIPHTPYTGEPSREPPPVTQIPILEKPILDSPILDFPTLVNPTQENPTQLNNNKALLNNYELSNKKQKHLPVSGAVVNACDTNQLSLEDTGLHQQGECLAVEKAHGADNSATHTMTLVEQQFELFWQLYPRKAGKKTAKKIWARMKPNETLFLAIITAIHTANQYWAANGTLQKHIPHPSTWLNEERWEDEFLSEQPKNCEDVTLTGKTGGEETATIGANYRIGGENDPYRELM